MDEKLHLYLILEFFIYKYINRDKDITRKKLVIAMATKEIEARKTLRCNIFFVFNIDAEMILHRTNKIKDKRKTGNRKNVKWRLLIWICSV
jgi:DNA-binding transcriptional regulator WhiA